MSSRHVSPTLLDWSAKAAFQTQLPCHSLLQKCNDAGFCRRNRGKGDRKFSVDPASLTVSGSTISAVLQNADAPGRQLALSLTAYKDGFIKLLVDEAPGVGRYRISDITSPDVEGRQAAWSKTSADSKGAVYSIGGAQANVELKFNPFRLAINSHGKPAVVLNSRDMFNFEHRRKKEVCQ
jgi:alpha 1,3-glucosidase